jgi:hypothetical protein
MKYRLLGKSGLRVSEAALGAMTFGEDWGWGSPKGEAQKVYETYREAGGNFLDTANLYTNGTSEKLVGEFIQGHRESVVVATKYSLAAPGNDPNAAGNHRKSMMQAVEASLKRLIAHPPSVGLTLAMILPGQNAFRQGRPSYYPQVQSFRHGYRTADHAQADRCLHHVARIAVRACTRHGTPVVAIQRRTFMREFAS